MNDLIYVLYAGISGMILGVFFLVFDLNKFKTADRVTGKVVHCENVIRRNRSIYQYSYPVVGITHQGNDIAVKCRHAARPSLYAYKMGEKVDMLQYRNIFGRTTYRAIEGHNRRGKQAMLLGFIMVVFFAIMFYLNNYVL